MSQAAKIVAQLLDETNGYDDEALFSVGDSEVNATGREEQNEVMLGRTILTQLRDLVRRVPQIKNLFPVHKIERCANQLISLHTGLRMRAARRVVKDR